MKNLIAIAAVSALFAFPALAQTEQNGDAEEITAEEIAAAAEVISEISEDQAKADGYCAIIREMEAVPEADEAQAEQVGMKMEEYLNSLGEGVADAFGVLDAVDLESEAAASLSEALEELDEKCGV